MRKRIVDLVGSVKVADKVIHTVIEDFGLWLDDLPPPREGDDPRCIVHNYIDGYLHNLDKKRR